MPNRVKEDARPRLIEYQRECYPVLFQHFYGKVRGELPLIEPDLDPTKEPVSVRLRMVSESNEIFGPRAAAELWFKLGLPVTPSMMHGPAQLTIDYSAIKAAEPAPDRDQSSSAA